VLVDAAKRLFPARVRHPSRPEPEDRPSRRIDVQDAAVAIDHDDAVIDAGQHRQYGDVRIRKSLLQPVASRRVFEYGLLRFDRDVIDADIALRTGA